MIHYAKMMSDGDSSIVVVDSRTPDWVAKGTIPSAINVPWTKLNPAKGATPIEIAEIMQDIFNVAESEGLFDFTNAKTAVMFCKRHVVRSVAEQHQESTQIRLSGT